MKFRKKNVIFLLGSILILWTLFRKDKSHTAGQMIQVVSESRSLNFAVMGDWGVRGKLQQKEVAQQLNAFTQAKGLDFIVTTGDNFYPRGVESVDDAHWKESYEDIYRGASMNIPWYPVLGNHDHGGNLEAQFAYSEESKSWTFPGRYYAVEYKIANGQHILMAFLDTSPFHDAYFEERNYEGIEASDSTAQKKWLEKVLSESKADWKLVFGHHPLYTGGMRAKDKPYVRMHLEELLQTYAVDAYICGHEHDLQHISPPGGVEYFVSGAAAMVRPTGKIKYTKYSVSQPGFMLFKVDQNRIGMEVIDYEGAALYQSSFSKEEQKPSLLHYLYELIAA
ncbi:MAG: metallophosphoesterase [Bacteroidia bacterium]|nr:metallophosphoesterase [Bacteroidia bacterium]